MGCIASQRVTSLVLKAGSSPCPYWTAVPGGAAVADGRPRSVAFSRPMPDRRKAAGRPVHADPGGEHSGQHVETAGEEAPLVRASATGPKGTLPHGVELHSPDTSELDARVGRLCSTFQCRTHLERLRIRTGQAMPGAHACGHRFRSCSAPAGIRRVGAATGSTRPAPCSADLGRG